MKKYCFLLIILIVLLTTLYADQKVVSLAPALTDIVFDLGKGKKLRGVTDYCKIPDEFENRIVRVGSAVNPSYEKIVKLNPDLVLLYRENQKIIKFLKNRGYAFKAFKHKSIEDIFNTVREISREFKTPDTGDKLVKQAEEKLNYYKKQTEKYNPKTVMVVIGRQIGGFENIYIAGNNEFIGEILKFLNLRNVYGGKINYPRVSLEGIMRMNPDIVIEVLPDMVEKYGKKKIKDDWKDKKHLNAVKNNRVYVMGEEFRIIPSLEIVEIADRFYNTIYGSKN